MQSFDLQNAVDAMLQGTALPNTFPSMGCSIKWNE